MAEYNTSKEDLEKITDYFRTHIMKSSIVRPWDHEEEKHFSTIRCPICLTSHKGKIEAGSHIKCDNSECGITYKAVWIGN